jgi:hypothetical protein
MTRLDHNTILTGVLLVLAAGVSAASPPQTLDEVRSDINLERRSRRALEYAHKALDRAVKAYGEGKPEEGSALLGEIQLAVELSKESLDETGKSARRSPKHFKHAEIETRKLLREMDHAERQLDYQYVERLQEVRGRVEEINHELLTSIMTKPKK